MKTWTKENALEIIEKIAKEIPTIKRSGRNTTQHMRWLANTLRVLEEIFGAKSRYFLTFRSFTWRDNGSMILEGWNIDREIEEKHSIAFCKQLDQAHGLLLAAKDDLEANEIEEVYKGENTRSETNDLLKIFNLGEKKLRKIIRTEPKKEREIQDKYEDLLIASEIEYSREFPHIEYSSKQYIPDFSFSKINLALEIKLCKNDGDEKGLIAQINDDILAYQTKFRNILFLIYDIGQIRDIEKFKSSFESHNDVIVQIVKQ